MNNNALCSTSPSFSLTKVVFAAMLCAGAVNPLLAGTSPTPRLPAPAVSASDVVDDGGYLTFFLDNDLFVGTDEGYTNGARLSWISNSRPALDIPFIQGLLENISGENDTLSLPQKIWGLRNPNNVRYSYGFSLSQLMFTPTTQTALTPPAGEHPYVGWTSVGISLHVRDEHALNSVELSIGTVGPHAFAQDTQDFIHGIRNIDKFQGWDSQMPNEPTINIFFNQRRRWTELAQAELPLGLNMDGFYETGYALGNFLTAAHVGFMVRVGWNLPVEFSDPRLTHTAHTQKLHPSDECSDDDWSCYLLFGARGSGIMHDITLDGPVFREFETGVERKPWVIEYYAGFGVRYRDWEFSYVHTTRSERFETQGGRQSFGSLAIRKKF
ncbi:MAG: lipid A deacylase LpxR family protein [Akkermansiaceae bacterium]